MTTGPLRLAPTLLGAISVVAGAVLIGIDRATAAVYTLGYATVGAPPPPPVAVITGWSLAGAALLLLGMVVIAFELGRRSAAERSERARASTH